MLPLESLQHFLLDLDHGLEEAMWSEDYRSLRYTYRGTAAAFMNAADKSEYTSLLKQIALEVHLPNRTTRSLSYEKFEPSYRKNTIGEEESVEIIGSINKVDEIGLHANDAFFFRMISFARAFAVDESIFLQFMSNVDPNKKIRLFLPTADHQANSFLSIHPFSEFSSGSPDDLKAADIDERKRIVKQREELARIDGAQPVPSVFNLEGNDQEVQRIFDRNLFLSVMIHLSNKFDGEKFQIRGNKSVEISIPNEFAPKNAGTMYQIFEYTFGLKDKHTFEKVQIARNAFSLYLQDDSAEKVDEILSNVRRTVERHFNLYINDTIKKFLDETKNEIKEAHKYAIEVRSEADKVTASINTALLSLLTTVIAGVALIGKFDRWILVLAFFLHLVYLVVSYLFNSQQTQRRKEDIDRTFKSYREEFVSLDDKEWAKIETTYYIPAVGSLSSVQKRYKIMIIGLSVVMGLLMVSVLLAPDSFFNKDGGIPKPQSVNAIERLNI